MCFHNILSWEDLAFQVFLWNCKNYYLNSNKYFNLSTLSGAYDALIYGFLYLKKREVANDSAFPVCQTKPAYQRDTC